MSPKTEAETAASKAPPKDEKSTVDKAKETKEEELSEDDKVLKEELDLCVTRLKVIMSGAFETS